MVHRITSYNVCYTKLLRVDQSTIAEDEVIAKTPTGFDRTVEPAKGPDPEITVPSVWTDETSNGMKVYGIEQSELPLIQS